MEAIIARALQIFIALGAAYFLALWFVLIVWAYRDIESRSKSVVTQIFSTLLVVLFFVPGALLYMVLRPKETLDSTFQRSLEEEYLMQDLEATPLCPSCQQHIRDDFKVCPNCRTQLREACPACERLVDLRWNICPYCSESQHRAVPLPMVERPDERYVAASVSVDELTLQVPQQIPAPAATPPVAPPLRPAALDDGADDELAAEAPAVLTVFHHGKQVATVRPFDRRNTRANGRRSATNNGAKPSQVDDIDDGDEELPEKYLVSGEGD
jgi:RNA polymerase subunit RPABC4/transcription elongation factor Spt4